MLIPLRSLWEEQGPVPPIATAVQPAAVLPRHIILERMEEEAMIATLLSED